MARPTEAALAAPPHQLPTARLFRSKLTSYWTYRTGQPFANLATDQVNADKVMPAFRNDYVCITFRGFDKLHMHRSDRSQILLDYRFHGASSFGNVPTQAANESDVVRSIDENFNIHLFEQTRLGKDENTFDDHNRFWLNAPRLVKPAISLEIVKRKVDSFACLQFANVVDQQIIVEGIRMIEVGDSMVIQRQIFQITVVGILLNENDLACTN